MPVIDDRVYFAQGVLVPWPNMAASALVMDVPSLWVCRMHAVHILHVLRAPDDRSSVQAWVGHHAALALYIAVMSRELMRRDGENARPLHQPFWPDGSRNDDHEVVTLPAHVRDVQMPTWIGDDGVHSTHRAFLDERIDRGGIRWL